MQKIGMYAFLLLALGGCSWFVVSPQLGAAVFTIMALALAMFLSENRP